MSARLSLTLSAILVSAMTAQTALARDPTTPESSSPELSARRSANERSDFRDYMAQKVANLNFKIEDLKKAAESTSNANVSARLSADISSFEKKSKYLDKQVAQLSKRRTEAAWENLRNEIQTNYNELERSVRELSTGISAR